MYRSGQKNQLRKQQYFGQSTGLMKIQALNLCVNNKIPFSEKEPSYAPYNLNIELVAAAVTPGRETGTVINTVPKEGSYSRLWQELEQGRRYIENFAFPDTNSTNTNCVSF